METGKNGKISAASPASSPVALRLPGLATGYQTVARIRRYAPLSGRLEIVSRMKGLITAAGLRNRQAQLPDNHRVVGAVVVAGDGVEVRQPVPVLIAGADVQPQQAGLLMVTQRLGRGQPCGRQLRNAVFSLETILQPGACPSACTATRSPLTQPCCLK